MKIKLYLLSKYEGVKGEFMNIGTIITMLCVGVGTAIGEKLLNCMGKTDLASLVNITGLSGGGATAVYFIVDLISKLRSLG